MKNLTIKNVTFNSGLPKICVSLCATNQQELVKQAEKYCQRGGFDVLEWRLDYFSELSLPTLLAAAKQLRTLCQNYIILATFRTKQEGGEQTITLNDYFALNYALIESNTIDMVDLELLLAPEKVAACIRYAHQVNVAVVVSNHDFVKTPSEAEIINRLCQMQNMGADLAKIAVMPHTPQDVLCLLSATNKMVQHHATIPVITMAMGKLGLISRLSGEIFGSAMTFGCIDYASAPGQIQLAELRKILDILHS